MNNRPRHTFCPIGPFLRWFACFRAQVVSVVVASEGRVVLNGTAPKNRDRPAFGCRNSYYD